MHSLEDITFDLWPRARTEILLQRVSKIPAILSLNWTTEIRLSSRLTKGYLRRCVLNWALRNCVRSEQALARRHAVCLFAVK